MIYIVRPLVHCYSLKINSDKSYKAYFTNLFMDLLWLTFLLIAEGFKSF